MLLGSGGIVLVGNVGIASKGGSMVWGSVGSEGKGGNVGLGKEGMLALRQKSFLMSVIFGF